MARQQDLRRRAVSGIVANRRLVGEKTVSEKPERGGCWKRGMATLGADASSECFPWRRDSSSSSKWESRADRPYHTEFFNDLLIGCDLNCLDTFLESFL